jgi:O-antigen ligase
MEEFVAQPLLGQGYSTRITGRVKANAQILDDQWLKTLLETGVLGVFAWLWLFRRFARRVAPRAKEDDGEMGWLLSAVTASVLAFAWGMFFYDAFAFIQATLLFYILAGLGMAALALPETARRPLRAPRPVQRPSWLPAADGGRILSDRPSRDQLAPN